MLNFQIVYNNLWKDIKFGALGKKIKNYSYFPVLKFNWKMA